MVTDPPLDDAGDLARLGLAAQQRFLGAFTTGRPLRADFDTADGYLSAALRRLPPGDPRLAEVSFALGALRLADHSMRCASPCPATGELRQVVGLLAVAGRRDGAPIRELYPYAMTAAKLAHHTDDRADVDLAMVLLRGVLRHRSLPAPAQREAQVALANLHVSLGALARGTRQPSGPGSASWAAYTAAIEQFEAVLAGLAGRGRRTDINRGPDRLDTLLGLLEAYGQRAGERPSDADAGTMAALARTLCATMTPDYSQRAYALGRAGMALLQRIAWRTDGGWDDALNAAILLNRATPIHEVLTTDPGLDADLDAAIGALSQAVGLEEQSSSRQPLFTAGLCAARALRYLAHHHDEDRHEFARLCRIVMGHPNVSPYYRRKCGEFLLAVLAHRLHTPPGAGAPVTGIGTVSQSPAAEADLATMVGLLGQFLTADGADAAPELAAAYAQLTTAWGSAELTDAELAAACRQLRNAAAAYVRQPAAHQAFGVLLASVGAELERRGVAPPGNAAERDDRTGDRAAQEAFDLLAPALLGAASHGRLAVPLGRVLETAGPLLAKPPGRPAEHAAIRCVLALALHQRWLRERAGRNLNLAIDHSAHAIGLLPDGHPLRVRLIELRAGMLLDRCQAYGDHADAEAARAALHELLRRMAGERRLRDLAGLTELLRTACVGTRSAAVGEMLVLPPGGGPTRLNRLEVRAVYGSALLLRAVLSGDPAGLADAIVYLRHVTTYVPSGHTRRPGALSDLGVALLAEARHTGDGAAARYAIAVLSSAAAQCPPGHPHRPGILLRAAGALAEDGGAGYDAGLAGQVIDLLTQALQTAGLHNFGDRARCLYGLGRTLMMRYERTRAAPDLCHAISSLEDARAGLDPAPGDLFTVPLLRTLGRAYRLAGTGKPGLRRLQSRETGKALLYAHGRAVLLQSGSWHGLSAARRIGNDTLRLVRWSLADGKAKQAVEALELGRGLVLHAATIAADVPALLDQVNRPDLAEEWRALAGAASRPDNGRTGGGLSAVPSDLRHRVLTALEGGDAERRLLSAPTVTQIAATLRSARLDALVYLIPAADEGSGHALIVDRQGGVEGCALPGLSTGEGSAVGRYVAAVQDDAGIQASAGIQDPAAGQPEGEAGAAAKRLPGTVLGDVCDWAWTTAIGPVLDRLAPAKQRVTRPVRLALAPIGALGIVPWHAARRSESPGTFRYACEEAVFSTCVSARQLTEAGTRRSLPRGQSPVFVANPTGRLLYSMWEADAACSALYPGAVYLGRSFRSARSAVAGPGTPAEVLAWMPGSGHQASVLHLGCHARAGPAPDQSWLLLAGEQRLPLSRILTQAASRAAGSPGGLVVLAACTSALTVADHDEALTLASGFLAAGATGVIGAQWNVPDVHTALLTFMMHRHLTRHPGDGPADALRAAQLWMTDSSRRVPPEMPARLAAEAGKPDVADPNSWAAFIHHGK